LTNQRSAREANPRDVRASRRDRAHAAHVLSAGLPEAESPSQGGEVTRAASPELTEVLLERIRDDLESDGDDVTKDRSISRYLTAELPPLGAEQETLASDTRTASGQPARARREGTVQTPPPRTGVRCVTARVARDFDPEDLTVSVDSNGDFVVRFPSHPLAAS
jgi:hypothetical protein